MFDARKTMASTDRVTTLAPAMCASAVTTTTKTKTTTPR